MNQVATILPLFASLSLAVACTPEIIVQQDPADPPTPSTSSAGGSGGSGSGGQAPAPVYDALAFSTLDPTGTTVSTTGTSGVTSGGGGVGEALEIVIGVPLDASTCAPPPAVAECGAWQVELRIPDSLVREGLVMSLEDANGFMTMTGENEGAEDCWWGGGSFWDGDLEILSITDDAIEIELRNTLAIDFDADGRYLARRCD